MRQLTCARSTAPSAVGISTISSISLASLASRPSTGLVNSGPARAAIKQAGDGEMGAKRSYQNSIRHDNFCIRTQASGF